MLAAGLARPTPAVRVLGADPQVAAPAPAPAIGLAPQEIGVYPQLRVRRTSHLRRAGGAQARRPARAAELLEPFALTELAERPAGRLSGGEQRRLHAAIALVNRRRLVVLDEPTAGADPSTRAHILQAVRDLAAGGTTVVYTTHHLAEVERLAPTSPSSATGAWSRARSTSWSPPRRAGAPPVVVVAPPRRRCREPVFLALTGARAPAGRRRRRA